MHLGPAVCGQIGREENPRAADLGAGQGGVGSQGAHSLRVAAQRKGGVVEREEGLLRGDQHVTSWFKHRRARLGTDAAKQPTAPDHMGERAACEGSLPVRESDVLAVAFIQTSVPSGLSRKIGNVIL